MSGKNYNAYFSLLVRELCAAEGIVNATQTQLSVMSIAFMTSLVRADTKLCTAMRTDPDGKIQDGIHLCPCGAL